MMECRPIDTPMDPNVKLLPGQGEPRSNPERYRRLVGKLNYLTDQLPVKDYSLMIKAMSISLDILTLIEQDQPLTDVRQNVVARSSAESEYRAMATTTCELVDLDYGRHAEFHMFNS
uniref:Reverse transcriptase Ty1/copia-type domain-containing protein n=1 Tax=Solanum lycopersicum TaxID=4081 RepID=A0A3Q7I9F3_SOLLC